MILIVTEFVRAARVPTRVSGYLYRWVALGRKLAPGVGLIDHGSYVHCVRSATTGSTRITLGKTIGEWKAPTKRRVLGAPRQRNAA